MWLPKPLYEVYPYLYVLTGMLVATIWRFSPFTLVSGFALLLGGLSILFLRFMYRRQKAARTLIGSMPGR